MHYSNKFNLIQSNYSFLLGRFVILLKLVSFLIPKLYIQKSASIVAVICACPWIFILILINWLAKLVGKRFCTKEINLCLQITILLKYRYAFKYMNEDTCRPLVLPTNIDLTEFLLATTTLNWILEKFLCLSSKLEYCLINGGDKYGQQGLIKFFQW